MKDMSLRYITQIAFGYWQCMPLFTLTSLSVFDILAEKELTLEAVCEKTKTPEETMSVLLNSGVALKFLSKKDDLYTNSKMANNFLASSGKSSLSHWIKLMHRWVKPWVNLEEVILTGKTAEKENLRLGEDEAYTKDFIYGIDEYAQLNLDDFLKLTSSTDEDKILDVGGGVGTYSIALCEKYASIKAKILDLGPVLELTRKKIEEKNLLERISIKEGDYRNFKEPESYTLAILSNILHQESEENVRNILLSTRNALISGGRCVIQGYFLDQDKTSPNFAVLQNLSAHVLWDGGTLYTIEEMVGLLEDAGYQKVSTHKMDTSGLTVIKGIKP